MLSRRAPNQATVTAELSPEVRAKLKDDEVKGVRVVQFRALKALLKLKPKAAEVRRVRGGYYEEPSDYEEQVTYASNKVVRIAEKYIADKKYIADIADMPKPPEAWACLYNPIGHQVSNDRIQEFFVGGKGAGCGNSLRTHMKWGPDVQETYISDLCACQGSNKPTCPLPPSLSLGYFDTICRARVVLAGRRLPRMATRSSPSSPHSFRWSSRPALPLSSSRALLRASRSWLERRAVRSSVQWK